MKLFRYDMFQRPFMGGVKKGGIIASGNEQQIIDEIIKVISNASEKYILGASCTLPGNIDWNNINLAIKTAHNYKV